MGFFIFQWTVLIVGFVVHAFADRAADRRTSRRLCELGALWLLVGGGGAFAIFGGVYHIGPTSDSIAEQIGYTQSMFQWEVGWADIAVGLLCLLCFRRAYRGQWMTAALLTITVYFWGDGIGHIMEIVAHNNHAPDNVWSMPTDFLMPGAAVVLTLLSRRPHPADASETRRQTAADQL